MTTVDGSDMVTEYLRLVDTTAVDDAGAMVLRHLEAGRSPQLIIRSLLAPAQVEAGERWHRGRWTIAQEHQATAISDAALHRLCSAVRPRSFRANVTVVCAEGDWHTLPSRMAAELLRLDGWRVTFLGGSLPAPDLAHWLSEARPDALVVTCSMPIFARGVHNIVTAAARRGVPVVAGGRGLGTDDRRAATLGVRWAADVADLSTALATGAGPVDHDALRRRLADSDAMTLRRDEIRDTARRVLGNRRLLVQGPGAPRSARMGQDIVQLLDFLSAAVLLDDPRVFTEFTDWLAALHEAHGVPAAVGNEIRALSTAVPPELGQAHEILAAATDTR